MNHSQRQFDSLEALTVKEVAELLHVSRPTVMKYIKLGELPSVQIGRCRRIQRSDLEDFLQIHRTREWQDYRPETAQPEDHHDGLKDFCADTDVIPF